MSQVPLKPSLGRWFRGIFQRRRNKPDLKLKQDDSNLEASSLNNHDDGNFPTALDSDQQHGESGNASKMDEVNQATSLRTVVEGGSRLALNVVAQGAGRAKEAKSGLDSDEERQNRVQHFIHEALNDERGFNTLSLLQEGDDQLATDEVWKLLFQSSTQGGSDENQRKALKYLLLKLIVTFKILPFGPVFTDFVQLCPDPDQHLQAADLELTQTKDIDPIDEAEDREKHERVQSFIMGALQREPGSDPALSLPEDIEGQDAIDECWNMLTSNDPPNDQKANLRRLCLKLILGLNTLPSAMTLEGVHYSEADLLGAGSFADVFRGEFQSSTVAVKRMREFVKMTEAQKQDLLKSLHREAFLWKLVDHPFVLPFLGISGNGPHQRTVTLVSPLAENGGIRDYIRSLQLREKLPVSSPEYNKLICHWLHQISIGVAYLHDQGIIHGDLHCGNILINAAGDVQLTDFGLALIADATSYNYASIHGGGALFTRAPELLDPAAKTTRPTLACDVYAYAFLCLELFTGTRAFLDVPELQVPNLILKGERPPRPPTIGGSMMLDVVWSLTIACWDGVPSQRPSMNHIPRIMEGVIELANGKGPTFSSQEVCRFNLPGYNHSTLAFFYDHVAYGTRAGPIEVYSIATKGLVHTLRGHTAQVQRVVGTKRALVSSSEDRTIRIWELLSGNCLHILRYQSFCSTLTISNPEMVDWQGGDAVNFKDSSKAPLIVYLEGKYITVLTFPSMPLPHKLDTQISSPEEVLVAECPYLKHRLDRGTDTYWRLLVQENIAVVSYFEKMEIWDIVAGERKWLLEEQSGYVSIASLIVPRGIVVASSRHCGSVWDIHTGERLHGFSFGESRKTQCQLPGSYIISQMMGRSMILWDPMSTQPVRPLLIPNSPLGNFAKIAHNSNYVACADDGVITVVDVLTGLMLGSLISGNFEVENLYMGEQFCAAVLTFPTKVAEGPPYQVVVWRLGDSNKGSEFEGPIWNGFF